MAVDRGGTVLAFLGVDISDETHYGTVLYGFQTPDMEVLGSLVQQCADVVLAAGGDSKSPYGPTSILDKCATP